jgi:hypothetical protein
MSLATITAKLRGIPRDFGETFNASYSGDAVSVSFDLPRDNVDADSVVAKIGATTLTPGTLGALNTNEYALDARAGVIHLWTPLATGSTLTVTGTAYLIFLPDDLTSYIDTAFQMHIRGRTPAPTYDTLPAVEEYLVALLAAIESLWALAVEASQEIDVLTPEGVNIPRSQRFAQIMALIDRLMAYYKELAAAFNVGPFAIRVLTLRRVSRTTGRLVPVYVDREFDDRTYPPVRVYPPIDNGLL